MKNRILCHRMEIAHISDIEKMDGDIIELKEDKSFITLLLQDKADYFRQSQHSDAGTVLNETVTARIKNEGDTSFLLSALKYFILKMYTDDGFFIVGTPNYPAELTFDGTVAFVNLNFKSSKHIL